MLIIRKPGGKPRSVFLTRPRTTIGRALKSDIVLDSPFVSKEHASIERCGEDLVVLDEHSTNGVFVNGQRIEDRHPLFDRDEVRIGELILEAADD